MFVRVSDLCVNDYIAASWLGVSQGSKWHRIFAINNSYSDSRKLNLSIERFGNVDLYKDDMIERQ